jgi:hypothetical protein
MWRRGTAIVRGRRRLAVGIIAAATVALLVALSLARHNASGATTVTVSGVPPAQLAAHALTLTQPTGSPSVSQSEAIQAAQKVFDHPVLGSQFSDCSQGDNPDVQDRLCWVVGIDPSGDTIMPTGADPSIQVVPDHADAEFVLIDANTGDLIIAIDHAPTNGASVSSPG